MSSYNSSKHLLKCRWRSWLFSKTPGCWLRTLSEADPGTLQYVTWSSLQQISRLCKIWIWMLDVADFINGLSLFDFNFFRECFHKISFRAKWNIPNWMSGQSLITAYMKYPEMKLITGAILLRSWKLILGDKYYVNTTRKWNHSKLNICACEYFRKAKIVDKKIRTNVNFISLRPQWKLM